MLKGKGYNYMERHEEGNKIDLMKYRLETAEELIKLVEEFCKNRRMGSRIEDS